MNTPTVPYHRPDSSTFSIHDVYYLLFRHKWKIILCSCLGFLAAATILLTAPETCRSQAKLLVRYVTETTTVPPEMSGNRMLTPDSRGQNIISTELHILTSQDVIGTVIEKIGVEEFTRAEVSARTIRDRIKARLRGWLPAYNDNEDQEKEQLDRSILARRIVSGLRVNNPKNTNIIDIEYHTSSPRLAQMTLKALIDAYLNKHYEIHRAVGAYGFLAQQVDQTRSRLLQTEAELRDLEAKVGFSSVQEADTALAVRREALQQQLWQLEGELAGALAEAELVEKWMASGSSTTGNEGGAKTNPPIPRAPDTDNSLVALKRREAELLGVYTEDSTPVAGLRAQIAKLLQHRDPIVSTNQSGLAAPTTASFGFDTPMTPMLLDAQKRIASLQARIVALGANLKELQAKEQQDISLDARIVELQRKRELEEANYKYFAQSLERARIDTSLDAEKLANISVVQPATYPAGFWSSPTLWRRILTALLVGVCGGLGLAFFTEKIADHSLRQPAEVETVLALPLLLTIPQKTARHGMLAMRSGASVTKLLPAHAGETDQTRGKGGNTPERSWTLQTDLKPYFEALRDRVIAFEKTLSSNAPCLLGMTGCLHHSGTTTMAAGLALTLARNGDGRVLFVDLSDLDHRRGNSLLDHAENVRLADIFADDRGRTTIMQPNLFVLSASEVTDEPQPIKASPRMEDVIGQLKNSEYDYVILDLPPINETSPTLRVAPLVDGIILIVEAEKVARTTAQEAKKLLAQAPAVVVGAILNRKKQYVPRWLEQGT